VWLPSESSEPGAIVSRLHYGFDEVQLRVYNTDKLAADILAACASYEPPCVDELEDEATHTGYVSTDSELTESLKQLCTQDATRPGRTVLQDIAEEAEGTQPDHGFFKLSCTTARQHPLPSSSTWQQEK